jgi:hypothetical protein
MGVIFFKIKENLSYITPYGHSLRDQNLAQPVKHVSNFIIPKFQAGSDRGDR